MMIDVGAEKLPARPELMKALEAAWRTLAAPGTWWNGAERCAIAAEVRQAEGCALCRRRKEALSPYTVEGRHDSLGRLPLEAVEASHRLATDAGRITQTWVRHLTDGALGEERYVEIVSVVAITIALDTFDRALGCPVRSLPMPEAGEPNRHRPAGARRGLAWVSTLAPGDVGPGDPNPFPVHGDKNIHLALSLVPQEVFNFFDLDVELYLRDEQIRDFSREYRAISHRQIELIAARASALNRCYY
jgi:hypothetical protein